MFSPNVRNCGPYWLRHLTMRFVSGAAPVSAVGSESVDASMYCSFMTSFQQDRLASIARNEAVSATASYQNSNCRVMIWIMHIIRHALDDTK